MKNFIKFKSVILCAFASILVGFIYAEDRYETFPPVFNLTTLDGENGFVINGIHAGDYSGTNVRGGIDINGDGFPDALIVGDHQGYVLFGDKKSWPPVIDLSSLNGKNGFAIEGFEGFFQYLLGNSISGIDDINGDGMPDILIGVPASLDGRGQCYVIFGSKGPWPPIININSLNGINGFTINGIRQGDMSGYSVSGAGDVNGDGIADMLIGTQSGREGQSYVLFGSKEGWPAKIELASLNGNNGFIINGVYQDWSGFAVSGAGDINGDGIADIIIGAPNANVEGQRGQSYVIFGSKKPWPSIFELNILTGNNGFAINGIREVTEGNGFAVNGAGDVNGDGIADIIIGAPSSSDYSGQSYVIFGSKKPWLAIFNLADLNGNNGFIINGISGVLGNTGYSVNGAGDINKDGIDDIIIGAPFFSSDVNKGQIYVIFGSKEVWPREIQLANLNGKNGFTINSIYERPSGFSLSGINDFNGDGIDDIIIASYALMRKEKGQSYVIFGQR